MGDTFSFALRRTGRKRFKEFFDGEFMKVFVEWTDEHGLWALRDEQEDGTITSC